MAPVWVLLFILGVGVRGATQGQACDVLTLTNQTASPQITFEQSVMLRLALYGMPGLAIVATITDNMNHQCTVRLDLTLNPPEHYPKPEGSLKCEGDIDNTSSTQVDYTGWHFNLEPMYFFLYVDERGGVWMNVQLQGGSRLLPKILTNSSRLRSPMKLQVSPTHPLNVTYNCPDQDCIISTTDLQVNPETKKRRYAFYFLPGHNFLNISLTVNITAAGKWEIESVVLDSHSFSDNSQWMEIYVVEAGQNLAVWSEGRQLQTIATSRYQPYYELLGVELGSEEGGWLTWCNPCRPPHPAKQCPSVAGDWFFWVICLVAALVVVSVLFLITVVCFCCKGRQQKALVTSSLSQTAGGDNVLMRKDTQIDGHPTGPPKDMVHEEGEYYEDTVIYAPAPKKDLPCNDVYDDLYRVQESTSHLPPADCDAIYDNVSGSDSDHIYEAWDEEFVGKRARPHN